MSETQTVIQRGDPATEALRIALMKDAQALTLQRMNQQMPRYQIAGLSAAEQQAMRQAQKSQGVGTPYLNQGSGAITAGQGVISRQGIGSLRQAQDAFGRAASGVAPQVRLGQQGLAEGSNFLRQGAAGVAPQVRQAQQGLYGATGQFSPSGIAAFMNPYEQEVIDRTMADIGRQGQIAQQGLQAQAVGAGAFGGSRQAIAQQELQRNVLEQQARTAGQLRQTGFESAGQRAQQAFEQSQGRSLAAAGQAGQLGLAGQQALGSFGQGIGALGGQAGQLGLAGQQALGSFGQGLAGVAGQFGTFGQQLGQLGTQQAALGQLAQQMSTQDIQNLLATGSLARGVQQAGLDAERLSNLQQMQQPFQSLGFLSDIYSGVPSAQSTVQASSMPQVSPFQTMIGLAGQGGTALLGANRAGLI